MLLLGTPGWAELALIAFIILLLFGKNRLPGLARSIGSGIHEFKKGISGHFEDEKSEEEEDTESPKRKQIPKKEKAAAPKSTGAKKTKTK